MEILFAVSGLPNKFTGGGAITAYSIIEAFISNGHNVSVLITSNQDDAYQNYHYDAAFQQLQSLNVELVFLPKFCIDCNKQSIIYRALGAFYHNFVMNRWVKNTVVHRNPDVIVAYHWCALEKLKACSNHPILGIFGDPLHLPNLLRTQLGADAGRTKNFKYFIQYIKTKLIDNVRYKLTMKTLLKACNSAGAFAYHHAKEYSELSARNCVYFCTPTPDPLNHDSESKSNLPSLTPKKLTLLLIGHMKGISTISGLIYFAREILPSLDKYLDPDNLEIRIVGGHFDCIPYAVQKILSGHPSCKIIGHVIDPKDEFLNCNAVLVPTPIELGIRVRIITSFSYGAPVVCHIANAKGIPELSENYNCLMGRTGKEIAQKCVSLYESSEIRKTLAMGARATYTKHFSPSVAGLKIVKYAESLSTTNKAIL